MEEAMNFNGNVSPESSPAPAHQSAYTASVTITLDDDDDDHEERRNITRIAPIQVPNSSSSLSPMQSPSHDDNAAFLSESNASSTLAASPSDLLPIQDNTSVESSRDSNSSTPTNEQPPEAIAMPSSSDDDEFTAAPPASAPHLRRLVSMDHIVEKVPRSSLARTQSTKPSRAAHNIDLSRGQVDTASPFESVKAAVSKYGGITDWKAHREQTVERRKYLGQELEKAQEEIPLYKKQCEVAEEAKSQVLKELDSTKGQIEELKLKLEITQQEDEKAKQDSVLAKLEVERIERGIADVASLTARAQLEAARTKHADVVAELNTAQHELEQVRKEYNSLLTEKDEAIRKTEEADLASKEAEKSIEEMAAELVTLKQSLESAYFDHSEVEDQMIEEVVAKELESLTWEKELRRVEEELKELNEEMLSTKDIRLKLDEATALLQSTKAEMTVYMESKSRETGKEVNLEDLLIALKKRRHEVIEATVTATKKEHAQVEQKIEKAANEVTTLNVLATSLKSELIEEISELAAVQQRKIMASEAIRSLEAELSIVKSEITLLQMKEAGEKKETGDLPKRQQQETGEAKAVAQKAHNELQKAEEEAEQAKDGARSIESRLHASRKEVEAARGSEKLAQAAINALVQSKSAKMNNNENSPDEVALHLGEYYELTRRVHEAEELANMRVAAAVSQVDAAKESESMSLNRLDEVTSGIARQKEALELALLKAEKAEAEKLAGEKELQKWKAKHEQKDKAVETVPAPRVTSVAPVTNFEKPKYILDPPNYLDIHKQSRSILKACTRSKSETESPPELLIPPRKKKKSFFPRFFMLLFKKKTVASTKKALPPSWR